MRSHSCPLTDYSTEQHLAPASLALLAILLFLGAGRPLDAQSKADLPDRPSPMVNMDVLRLLPLAPKPVAGFAGAQDQATFGDDPLQDRREPYHWKGLFVQSLEFNMIENAWRIATDEQIRSQLGNKPFWHDYAASLKQFNMGRWNDGDSFMVNYVGHSLHGAVSGYIQIQNDPKARMLEIGKSREYWKSRAWAMLWSTIYSTQSEIGPLGEAALGNEGGFTYPRNVDCDKPCSKFRPGIDTYTNNTGWVDFIITPTVGTLWILAEDTLDRFIADAYQSRDIDYRLGYPKILRASLTPARSFANVLRGQKPWYRDWQNKGTPYFTGVHVTKSDEQLEEEVTRPRFEISPHFAALSIAVNTPNCRNCRRVTTGEGVEVSYRLAHWVDADIDFNRMADASPLPSDRAGGNLYNGLFGLRTGFETENYALKLALRPGFVQFDKAYQTSPAEGSTPPATGTITHFVWNAALSGDYRLGRNFALRGTIGETLVRYRASELDPPGIGTVPYLSWLSHENYVNRGSWTIEAGPVFRFGSSSHGE